MEIPRVFASSEHAAEARLNFLLKKDVLYLRRKGSGALAALGFAPRDSFVMEVVAWILTVCVRTRESAVVAVFIGTQVEPPQASTINASTEARVHSRDLYEQLTTHHDTRFLAVLIFMSFFFSVSARTGEECHKVADYPDVGQRAVESDEIQKMVVWDYAVSAIALAVKVRPAVCFLDHDINLRVHQIHRDNLPPLRPIYARHFLAMAPHEMSFDDLEVTHPCRSPIIPLISRSFLSAICLSVSRMISECQPHRRSWTNFTSRFQLCDNCFTFHTHGKMC